MRRPRDGDSSLFRGEYLGYVCLSMFMYVSYVWQCSMQALSYIQGEYVVHRGWRMRIGWDTGGQDRIRQGGSVRSFGRMSEWRFASLG